VHWRLVTGEEETVLRGGRGSTTLGHPRLQHLEVPGAENASTPAHSLAIGDLAVATNRPEKFVGLHFFNPVPVMKLLEVVRTDTTDPQVFQVTWCLS
jgi:hypothetical protein